MKVMIAIPCMDTMPVEFVESLLYTEKPQQTAVFFKPNSVIYDSRNILSIHAIQHGYDYVMWFDSDMVIPRDAITQLLHDVEKTKSHMVSGLYVKRSIPTEPVLFSEIKPPALECGHMVKKIKECNEYPRDSLFLVDGCGFGCVLTSVPLLKAVWDKYGPAFAPYAWTGEDISFCYRVRQLGYYIWCDSRVKCGHVGSHVYTEDDLGGGENEKH